MRIANLGRSQNATVRVRRYSMATTTRSGIAEFLASLPDDRRAALQAVRDVVNANLPEGYVEGMVYNDKFIGWYVPPERYVHSSTKQPIGPAALTSQKNYMALYLVSVYSDPDAWFRKAYAASGKKLDMGKSCVRFKTLDALPLDVIGQTIAKVPVDTLIAQHEAALSATNRASARAVRTTKTQGAAKKAEVKKAPKKTTAKNSPKKAAAKKARNAPAKKATKKSTKKATKKVTN